MPIERRNSTTQIRAILIAVVSVIFAATLGYALFRVATGQGSSVLAGSNNGEWNAGAAERLSAAIAEDGPILLSDVSGAGQRLPVYLSHLGNDPEQRWFAFEARPPEAPTDCFLTWNRSKEVFTASCSDGTFPAEGTGLRQFPAEVTKAGDVVIDLKPDGD